MTDRRLTQLVAAACLAATVLGALLARPDPRDDPAPPQQHGTWVRTVGAEQP